MADYCKWCGSPTCAGRHDRTSLSQELRAMIPKLTAVEEKNLSHEVAIMRAAAKYVDATDKFLDEFAEARAKHQAEDADRFADGPHVGPFND